MKKIVHPAINRKDWGIIKRLAIRLFCYFKLNNKFVLLLNWLFNADLHPSDFKTNFDLVLQRILNHPPYNKLGNRQRIGIWDSKVVPITVYKDI